MMPSFFSYFFSIFNLFQPNAINQQGNNWMLTKLQCIETCRGKSSQYLYAVFSEVDKRCDCIKIIPHGLSTYSPGDCNNRNYKVSLAYWHGCSEAQSSSE